MKREIKFRAKAINNEFFQGVWVEGYYAKVLWNGELIDVITDGAHEIPIQVDTLGQFAGMLDKNKNKIYEGDIILVKGLYHRVVLWDKISFALMPCEFYHDKTFWVMNLQHPEEDWWELFTDEIEVVGNIYDTPELLKGEKQ